MTFFRWIAAVRVGWKRAMAIGDAHLRRARSSEYQGTLGKPNSMFPGKSAGLFGDFRRAKHKTGLIEANKDIEGIDRDFQEWTRSN